MCIPFFFSCPGFFSLALRLCVLRARARSFAFIQVRRKKQRCRHRRSTFFSPLLLLLCPYSFVSTYRRKCRQMVCCLFFSLIEFSGFFQSFVMLALRTSKSSNFSLSHTHTHFSMFTQTTRKDDFKKKKNHARACMHDRERERERGKGERAKEMHAHAHLFHRFKYLSGELNPILSYVDVLLSSLSRFDIVHSFFFFLSLSH